MLFEHLAANPVFGGGLVAAEPEQRVGCGRLARRDPRLQIEGAAEADFRRLHHLADRGDGGGRRLGLGQQPGVGRGGGLGEDGDRRVVPVGDGLQRRRDLGRGVRLGRAREGDEVAGRRTQDRLHHIPWLDPPGRAPDLGRAFLQQGLLRRLGAGYRLGRIDPEDRRAMGLAKELPALRIEQEGAAEIGRVHAGEHLGAG